jgi:hypothetical protein
MVLWHFTGNDLNFDKPLSLMPADGEMMGYATGNDLNFDKPLSLHCKKTVSV